MTLAQITTIVITFLITAALTALITYFKTATGQLKALKEGMLATLRADIIGYHDKYMDREYCPIYAKDAIEKAYQAYHKLGGNGTITKLYEDLMALPTEPKGG